MKKNLLNPAEAARRLAAYIEEQYAKPRTHSDYRACLCELTDADAAHALAVWDGVDREHDLDKLAECVENESARCRSRALALAETGRITVVQATERFCELADGHVFPAARARELLAWLEGQRDLGDAQPARSWILEALRRAVTANHAFAIVFDMSLL